MYNLNIDEIWRLLKKYEGYEFHTVAEQLPFTYKFISENTIKTNRTKYNLSKSNFKKAINLLPVKYVSEITHKIRGASYIFAILTDPRFQEVDINL